MMDRKLIQALKEYKPVLIKQLELSLILLEIMLLIFLGFLVVILVGVDYRSLMIVICCVLISLKRASECKEKFKNFLIAWRRFNG